MRTARATSKQRRSADAAHGASVRERVIHIFSKHGRMTDEEILREYTLLYGAVHGGSVRTRRRELERDGQIRDCGELGIVAATGRRCIIWEPVFVPVGKA